MPNNSNLNENEVIDAVCRYLTANGYEIHGSCTTTERGIDIEATRPSESGHLLIEAKGGTSSKETSRRYVEGFSSNQVRQSLEAALYKGLCLHCKHRMEGHIIGLAFPDNAEFRKCLEAIRPVLAALNIRVFLVGIERGVSEF